MSQVSQLSPSPELEPDYRDYEPIHPEPGWKSLARKLWAPLVALGAFLAKFGVVLLKFKFLWTMFVSAAVYIWLGGWAFGIGLIVLLFIHEMGHVIEAKRQGLPVSAPMFIPFLGAFITMRKMPEDAWREAQIGIAGPLLGSAGAAALFALGVAYDSRALKAIAFLGFFINLFNLLPVSPLDGGRIAAALHPGMWFLGVLGLLALVLYRPNPILILILLVAAMEIWQRWQLRRLPQVQAYYRVAPHRRLAMGLLYFGLAAALVFGMHATHVPHDF
jgi:Zn-dependent protease